MVLKALAQHAHEFLATKTTLDSPLFARFGGEEFLILLPGAGEETAFALADTFRRGVEGRSFKVPAKLLHITISAGTATYRDGDRGVDAMLKRADTALYVAKAQGRNQVCGSD